MLGPQRSGDLGHGSDLGRQQHLVAVVEQPRVALACGVGGQQRHQGPAPTQRLQHVPLGRRREHLRLDLPGEQLDVGVEDLTEPFGAHPVLRALPGQGEHGDRDRSGLEADVERVRPVPHHAVDELVGCALTEEPDRVQVEQRGVVGHDVGREGVVGARLGALLQHGREVQAARGPRTRADPGLDALHGSRDAFAELTGGLAGEGQAQHLVRPDLPGAHQPRHPQAHRLRLAGAGARDHQRAVQRRGDHRALLRPQAVPQTEGLLHLGHVRQQGDAHAGATGGRVRRPSGVVGQLVRTRQRSQALDGVATKA